MLLTFITQSGQLGHATCPIIYCHWHDNLFQDLPQKDIFPSIHNNNIYMEY